MQAQMDLLMKAARQEAEALVAYANAARDLHFATAQRVAVTTLVRQESHARSAESSSVLLTHLAEMERVIASARAIVDAMADNYTEEHESGA